MQKLSLTLTLIATFLIFSHCTQKKAMAVDAVPVTVSASNTNSAKPKCCMAKPSRFISGKTNVAKSSEK
jgi:hypothetical protein